MSALFEINKKIILKLQKIINFSLIKLLQILNKYKNPIKGLYK